MRVAELRMQSTEDVLNAVISKAQRSKSSLVNYLVDNVLQHTDTQEPVSLREQFDSWTSLASKLDVPAKLEESDSLGTLNISNIEQTTSVPIEDKNNGIEEDIVEDLDEDDELAGPPPQQTQFTRQVCHFDARDLLWKYCKKTWEQSKLQKERLFKEPDDEKSVVFVQVSESPDAGVSSPHVEQELPSEEGETVHEVQQVVVEDDENSIEMDQEAMNPPPVFSSMRLVEVARCEKCRCVLKRADMESHAEKCLGISFVDVLNASLGRSSDGKYFSLVDGVAVEDEESSDSSSETSEEGVVLDEENCGALASATDDNIVTPFPSDAEVNLNIMCGVCERSDWKELLGTTKGSTHPIIMAAHADPCKYPLYCCPIHTVARRRLVSGRAMSFDALALLLCSFCQDVVYDIAEAHSLLGTLPTSVYRNLANWVIAHSEVVVQKAMCNFHGRTTLTELFGNIDSPGDLPFFFPPSLCHLSGWVPVTQLQRQLVISCLGKNFLLNSSTRSSEVLEGSQHALDYIVKRNFPRFPKSVIASTYQSNVLATKIMNSSRDQVIAAFGTHQKKSNNEKKSAHGQQIQKMRSLIGVGESVPSYIPLGVYPLEYGTQYSSLRDSYKITWPGKLVPTAPLPVDEPFLAPDNLSMCDAGYDAEVRKPYPIPFSTGKFPSASYKALRAIQLSKNSRKEAPKKETPSSSNSYSVGSKRRAAPGTSSSTGEKRFTRPLNPGSSFLKDDDSDSQTVLSGANQSITNQKEIEDKVTSAATSSRYSKRARRSRSS